MPATTTPSSTPSSTHTTNGRRRTWTDDTSYASTNHRLCASSASTKPIRVRPPGPWPHTRRPSPTACGTSPRPHHPRPRAPGPGAPPRRRRRMGHRHRQPRRREDRHRRHQTPHRRRMETHRRRTLAPLDEPVRGRRYPVRRLRRPDANSTLATWTIWAGPSIDHPTWTVTASPYTPSVLLADLAENLAHGTGPGRTPPGGEAPRAPHTAPTGPPPRATTAQSSRSR
nr:DUF317 domain-containing protein [Streptomyces sp. LBUM 1477]